MNRLFKSESFEFKNKLAASAADTQSVEFVLNDVLIWPVGRGTPACVDIFKDNELVVRIAGEAQASLILFENLSPCDLNIGLIILLYIPHSQQLSVHVMTLLHAHYCKLVFCIVQ